MAAREAAKAGYICNDCAEANGGVWPEGHVATFHSGKCGLCGEAKFVASWDDWDWPKDRAANRSAKSSREL